MGGVIFSRSCQRKKTFGVVISKCNSNKYIGIKDIDLISEVGQG